LPTATATASEAATGSAKMALESAWWHCGIVAWCCGTGGQCEWNFKAGARGSWTWPSWAKV